MYRHNHSTPREPGESIGSARPEFHAPEAPGPIDQQMDDDMDDDCVTEQMI